MLKYTEKAETPLKWHRFNQAVLMPLIILSGIYLTICTICVRMGRSTSWMFNTDALLAPQDDKWLYYISFAFVILETLIVLQAWLRSFRWIRSSWWYQMSHYLTLVLYACYAFSEIYRKHLSMVIGMNLHLYLDLSISSRWIFLIAAVILALTIMYCALSLVYYGERHRLYRRMVVEKVTIRKPETRPAEISGTMVNQPQDAENADSHIQKPEKSIEQAEQKTEEKEHTASEKPQKTKHVLFSLKQHEKKPKKEAVQQEETEPAPEPIAVPSPLTKEQKEQLEQSEYAAKVSEPEAAEPILKETVSTEQEASKQEERIAMDETVAVTAAETTENAQDHQEQIHPAPDESTDSQKPLPPVRFCSHCGAKLKVPGARFCPVCGQPIHPADQEKMADHD